MMSWLGWIYRVIDRKVSITRRHVGFTLFIILIILIFHQLMTSIKDSMTIESIRRMIFKNTNEEAILKRGYDYNITVVTAFYNIGKFPKGGFHNMRTPQQYLQWSRAYKNLNGTLIVYSDSDVFIDTIRNLRKGKEEITRIIKISREKLWPFKLKEKVQNIFKTPGYPSHQPNTVIPDYSLLQHSKFAFVDDAIKKKYFYSRHYCWLDIGVFRDIAGSNKTFHVQLPPNFTDTHISYNRLFNSDPSKSSARSIFIGNQVWITGNAFIGTEKTLEKFCDQYKRTVKYYISQGLANTDQQVLMAMYTKESISKLNIEVSIQQYVPGKIKGVICPDNWFYLAYLMINDFNKRKHKSTTANLQTISSTKPYVTTSNNEHVLTRVITASPQNIVKTAAYLLTKYHETNTSKPISTSQNNTTFTTSIIGHRNFQMNKPVQFPIKNVTASSPKISTTAYRIPISNEHNVSKPLFTSPHNKTSNTSNPAVT